MGELRGGGGHDGAPAAARGAYHSYDEVPAVVRAAYHSSRVSFKLNESVLVSRLSGAAGDRLAAARGQLRLARAEESRDKEALHEWLEEREAEREHLAMVEAASPAGGPGRGRLR